MRPTLIERPSIEKPRPRIIRYGPADVSRYLPEKVQRLPQRDQQEWGWAHGMDLVREIRGGSSDTMAPAPSLSAKDYWTGDQYFRTRPWIDICSFSGVDPTGVLDSAAGVQAALDSVPAQGATVFAPWGTYKIGTPLVAHNYTRLMGFGTHSYDVSTFGATTFITSGAIARLIDARNTEGFVMENLQLDGNVQTGGTIALLDLDGSTGGAFTPMTKILGCRISLGANRGIYCAATWATFVCHIDRCMIGYNLGDGIRADTNSINDSYITNSYIAANAKGISLGYCGNVDIIGNHIEFNHGIGIECNGEDLRILGGLIDRNDGPGVQFQGALRCYLGGGVWTRRNGVTQGSAADTNANVYILNSTDIIVDNIFNHYDFDDAGSVPEVPYNGITVQGSRSVTLSNIKGTGGTFRFVNDLGGNTALTYDGVNGDMMTEGPTTGVSVLTGHLRLRKLASPAAPSLSIVGGAAGAYSYKIVAVNGEGDSLPGATTATAVGPTTLSATNYIDIDWAPVQGAMGYKVIRVSGGPSNGVLPSHGASPNTALTFSAGDNTHYHDTGKPAVAYVDATFTKGGGLRIDSDIQHSVQTPTEAVLVSGVPADGGEIVRVTITAARVVGAPLRPALGDELTFEFTEGGAGAFAITWNAIFKVTWSNTGNTTGKISTITVYYNGTNWCQRGAQAPFV